MKSTSRADDGWLQVMGVLVLGVLMCLASTSALPQTVGFDISDATNLPGSDYNHFPVQNDDLYTCVNACRNDAQCQAFTYVQGPQAHCWLKNTVPGKSPDNCCLSGVKKPQPSLIIAMQKTWEQDGIDLPGGDYRSIPLDAPDVRKCSATCAGDSKCRAFTYVKPGIQGPAARCYLKSTVAQVKAVGCCASGIIVFPPTDIGQVSLEPATDRQGFDYKSVNLQVPDVRLCADACKADAACKAYTYVKPGVLGPEARCYVKNVVPVAKSNGCCASGVKVPDSSQNTPLARGVSKDTPLDCSQSTVADIFDKICDVMPSFKCSDKKKNCTQHTRQIYVGSTFSAATQAEFNKWQPLLGGRGALLGEAAMCALRELSPKATIGSSPTLGGPVETPMPLQTILGDVSVKQQVGFVKFDPVALQFDGYRNMRFCAPVVGCYDSVAQDVRIKLDRVKVNPPLTAGAGGPKLAEQLILTVTTETSDKTVVLKPPSFVVATPLGPVSVEPEFDYASRDSVIDSPYQSSNQTLRRTGDEPGWAGQGRLKDIYGVDYGIAFPYLYSVPWGGTSGWLSATALGNRDPSKNNPAWTVADERPDRKLSLARTSKEKDPSTEIAAFATITYPKGGDLGSLVPDWIKNLGADIKLSIFVEPRLRAAASGQFDILAAEGVISPGDIGAGGDWSGSDLAMLTGVGGAFGFGVNTGLDLVVTIPFFPSPIKIEAHPRWNPPFIETAVNKPGNKAYFASRAGPWTATEPRTYTHFRTFKYGPISSPLAELVYPYVQACVAPSKNVPDEPKPEPTATPGDASKIVAPDLMEWPCNICVFSDAKKSGGFLFPVTRPPGAKSWVCNWQYKSGCYDLCRFNPATNQLTFLRSPDKNLKIGNSTGDLCFYEPPH
jgi:hypothetical protein